MSHDVLADFVLDIVRNVVGPLVQRGGHHDLEQYMTQALEQYVSGHYAAARETRE
jgi:hypothetical protein